MTPPDAVESPLEQIARLEMAYAKNETYWHPSKLFALAKELETISGTLLQSRAESEAKIAELKKQLKDEVSLHANAWEYNKKQICELESKLHIANIKIENLEFCEKQNEGIKEELRSKLHLAEGKIGMLVEVLISSRPDKDAFEPDPYNKVASTPYEYFYRVFFNRWEKIREEALSKAKENIT